MRSGTTWEEQGADLVVAIVAKGDADIRTPYDDDLLQNRGKLCEGGVSHVSFPGVDEDAIFRLELEVLHDVVDDNHFFEVSTQLRHVLDAAVAMRNRVLAVESVHNPFVRVNGIQRPIRIVLCPCSEDHQLVVLRHL